MSDMSRTPAAELSPFKLGLALGLLSAIGPVSIDLYLPAFPIIARDLQAAPGEVQRTLSFFFFALALAQIPVGAFGDRFGRKAPLYLGLGLFVLASLACAVATSIDALIALRFVQGFGVCAGTAVSRAMIRDLKTGHAAARLMASSFLIIGISPILAPLIGTGLMTLITWRGLFLALAALGVAGLALTALILPESLPPERRRPRGTPILPAFAALLTDGRFLAAACVAGLATTIPYAYVTAAPFVFVGVFALTAKTYSLLLALNAACSIATTQASPILMRHWGARDVLLRVSLAGVLLTTMAAVAFAVGGASLVVFEIFSMMLFALAGLLLTPAAISALDAGAQGAGAAAGLLGALQLLIVAAASGVVSLFPAFSLAPLLLVLGGALVLSALLSLRRPQPRAAVP